MNSLLRLFAVLLLITAAGSGSASAATLQQDINRTVEHFLHAQTRGLPGKASFVVSPLVPGTQLTPCPAMEAFLPAGGRLWGRITVGVRCQVPGGWTIYVPVNVSVETSYVVSTHPLYPGQPIGAGDISLQRGDLANLPNGVVTAPEQAMGKTVRSGVGAGFPLRMDMLTAPLVVQQGQTVRVISTGPGFSVTSEGRALNNGAEGQVVQVRLQNGQAVSGIARSGGVVEVAF